MFNGKGGDLVTVLIKFPESKYFNSKNITIQETHMKELTLISSP